MIITRSIVKRQGGDWHFINRYGKDSTKKEGPYQQAQGNEQSLRLYLEKGLKISRILFVDVLMPIAL